MGVKEQELNSFRVGKKEQYAARIIFFIAGFGMSTWAPMIPIIKERLQIGADILGLLLLCIGVSSFLMMPIAGLFAQKFGCKKVLRIIGLCMGIEIIILSILPNIYMYAIFLFVLGAIGGIIKCKYEYTCCNCRETFSKANDVWYACFMECRLFCWSRFI